MLAKDVAAALFKPSRPRSNSNLSDTATSKRNGVATNATTSASPTLFPSIGTTPPNNFYPIENSNCGYYLTSGSYQQHDHYQDAIAQQIQATAELLLSMQSDLSTNAALSASIMANGDVNIAYYLIDQAMNAPPVCRHMLQYTCYRADCAFSHDVGKQYALFRLSCHLPDSRMLHIPYIAVYPFYFIRFIMCPKMGTPALFGSRVDVVKVTLADFCMGLASI